MKRITKEKKRKEKKVEEIKGFCKDLNWPFLDYRTNACTHCPTWWCHRANTEAKQPIRWLTAGGRLCCGVAPGANLMNFFARF